VRMKVELSEPVMGSSTDELLLGRSSWDDDAASLKYGWPDKNGKRTRGGEIPLTAVPQAVLFAARHQYLSRKQMAIIAKGLIDILAKPG
jgi:hypothetical protein